MPGEPVAVHVAADPQPVHAPRRVHVHARGRLADLHLRAALLVFGGLAKRAAARRPRLRFALEQSHLPHLPDAFLALTWLNTLLAGLGGAVLVLGGLAAAQTLGRLPPAPVVAVALLVPFLAASCAYVVLSIYPDYRAGERRRLIDKDLPYAVNYVAAMSSAGVVPAVLLRDLAREKTYGEVSREVAWMVRDLDLLGVDLLTALSRGIARSPSRRFQEFLQGAKTTILSGGDLKTYFASKAEQYMAENRRVQREFLDSLGILAESYVTVVIAGPLFMLVMLSIMLIVGSGTAATQAFLFLLAFVLLPVTHTTFAWLVRNMAPEG